jgi:mannose-6-phosphate isomerase
MIDRPIALPPNPIERFYAGGPSIAAFRGVAAWSSTAPEDWVGSATSVAGERVLGRSLLADGSTLADTIAADPEGILGPSHVARFGADPGLLVKLLHAGERLPVHWHPDRAFAASRLGSPYGKTEAWFVLEAASGGDVHLGWRRDVDEADLRAWSASQDAGAMLDAMHRVEVRAGDAILVPAGQPHAIGEGILLVELQEPTDLSVLLEWKGFCDDPASIGDLGLGYDVALGSGARRALSPADLDRLRSIREAEGSVWTLFPAEADPFFRADVVGDGGELEPGFSILVVFDGDGSLAWHGGEIRIRRGDTLLVPFRAGAAVAHGDVAALRCRPPLDAPDAVTNGPPTRPEVTGG